MVLRSGNTSKRKMPLRQQLQLIASVLLEQINVHEGRDNMSFDIPGAFVTTKTNECVSMTLWDHLCKIVTRIDPKLYRKYITKDKKGKPVLYVQL